MWLIETRAEKSIPRRLLSRVHSQYKWWQVRQQPDASAVPGKPDERSNFHYPGDGIIIILVAQENHLEAKNKVIFV